MPTLRETIPYRQVRQQLLGAGQLLGAVCGVIWHTLLEYLAFDIAVAVITLLFVIAFAPLIPRTTENAHKLAAFINDEPALTMALEAMTVRPYGNPANFYGRQGHTPQLPAHWGHIRYAGFTYYGGTYLDLGYLVFGPLQALGVSTFPTAPIILRTISALAGLLSLILLYNFARRYAGTVAGCMAVVFLMTDSHFLYYTNIIHPDTLQLFLALLALLVAVRHTEDGQMPSLLALGALIGLVHGTKAGGPWLIPMALMATYGGIRHVGNLIPTRAGFWRLYGYRLGCMGAVALLAFFVSTPYAFLDRYYFAALSGLWKLLSTGPLGKVTFFTWMRDLRTHLGDIACVLVCLALLRIVYQTVTSTHVSAFALATVLALSQLVWFGMAGGLWVVLGYMLLAFGLGAVITFDTMVKIMAMPLPAGKWVGRWQAVVLLGIGAVIVEARWFMLADYVAQLRVVEHSTTVEINRWAQSVGIPPASHILHDDTAYFDPKVFPNSQMYGGVLTWPALRKMQPEIIVLSSSIYDAPWYKELRQTQNFSREHPYPFSVRLYQDLVEYEMPGPTSISGVELLKVIRPTDPNTLTFVSRPFITWLQPQLTTVIGENVAQWMVAKLVQNARHVTHITRLIHNALGREHDLFGPTLKIYRFDLSQPSP